MTEAHRTEAEALARRFLTAAGAWGAPQPTTITWALRIVPPAVPVRAGVTLCAPWVDAYERELEPVLKLTASALPEKPTADLHPNASLDVLQLLRDEWRHDVHRQHLSHRPDPWEPLIALRLLGVVANHLTAEHLELAEILPYVEARDETGVTPSKSKLKAFRKRAVEILGRGTTEERIVIAPPRYDQVFEEGARWLDSLAGDTVPEGDVSLSVSDDVWKSGSRERHE